MLSAGAENWSLDMRDDVLLPQQMHWLLQAVSANSKTFTVKATTLPTTQRFSAILHMGGVEAGAASISAMRWDSNRNIYKVVQETL